MAQDVVNSEAHRSSYQAFHFSQAARSGDLLICSGQIGLNPDGRVPEAAEDEFRAAWAAVGAVLDTAGRSFDHIIEYTTFHVNLQEHLPAFMKVRDEFLEEPWPAWTAIGITELAVPGARVEIRVVAGLK